MRETSRNTLCLKSLRRPHLKNLGSLEDTNRPLRSSKLVCATLCWRRPKYKDKKQIAYPPMQVEVKPVKLNGRTVCQIVRNCSLIRSN